MIRSRRILAVFTVAAFAVGIAAATALAQSSKPYTGSPRATPPSTASFTVSDDAFTAAGTGGDTVTIAPGGTVTFTYGAGTSMHNVDFGKGAPQPTSCTLNGSPATAPVPATATAPVWTATCTFATVGTYTFHCDLHTFMTGTIVVSTTTTTTTTTTPSTTSTPGYPGTTPTGTNPGTGTGTGTGPTGTGPGTTSTTTGTMPGMAMGSPLSGPAAKAIGLATRQSGPSVKGTAAISAAGAGGQLKVQVLAKRHALTPASKSTALVALGSSTQRLKQAGTAHFTVKLSRAGSAALTRLHRLTVTVKVTVSPSMGSAVSTTRTVTLTAPRG